MPGGVTLRALRCSIRPGGRSHDHNHKADVQEREQSSSRSPSGRAKVTRDLARITQQHGTSVSIEQNDVRSISFHQGVSYPRLLTKHKKAHLLMISFVTTLENRPLGGHSLLADILCHGALCRVVPENAQCVKNRFVILVANLPKSIVQENEKAHAG